MKKLALLTALALSLNCFACFGASAEETDGTAEAAKFSYEMNFDAITPVSWVNTAPDKNWTVDGTQLFYKKLDDEHGTSLVLRSSASPKIAFKFPSVISGEARISFDLYLTKSFPNTITIQPTNAAWGTTDIATINGTTMAAQGSKTIGDVKTGEWHRVDIIINSNPDAANEGKLYTYAEFYFDGKKNDSIRSNMSTLEFQYLSFLLNGTGGNDAEAYIDNFSASYPKGAETLVAAMNSDGTKITFNRTVDRKTISENAVTVKEYNLENGTEKNVSVTAEADVSATGLDLIYSNPMQQSCKYVYTLSDDIKGIFGETLADTTFEYVTDIDYYQKLTDLAAGTEVPVIGRAGVYDGNWNLKDESKLQKVSFAKSWVTNLEGLVIQQKRVLVTPKHLTSGKYAISFDLYNQQNETTYLNLGDMSVTGDDVNLLFFDLRENKGNAINIGPNWNQESANIGTHEVQTWKHYDLIFNLGTDVEIWQDGTKLGAMNYTRGLDYLFFAGSDNGRAIKNLHMRNIYSDNDENITNKNIVTTTLDGAVAAGTKTAKISFRDPIKPELISSNAFALNDEDLNSVKITVSDVTSYGATLTFAEPLKKGVEYELSMSKNMTSYIGEELSKVAVVFTPIDMHKVTNIYATANNQKIGSVSAWDKTADVTITIDTESSRSDAKVYVVVAGYNSNDKMIGVGITPIETSGSGSFSGTLDKLDLTGAKTIKYFAIDSLSNLSPLTNKVISIN